DQQGALHRSLLGGGVVRIPLWSTHRPHASGSRLSLDSRSVDADHRSSPYAGPTMSPSTADRADGRPGVHGILAPAARLDRWLLVVLVVLVVTCAVRYVDRHGLGATGVAVLAGALLLVLAYATRTLLPEHGGWPTAWVVGIVVLWG